MSFGGHALDMIRRLKDNRQLLDLRRERTKGKIQRLSNNKTSASINPNITAEEWGRVSRELREHEIRQQNYYVRMTLIILGILTVAALTVFVVFKLFMV